MMSVLPGFVDFREEYFVEASAPLMGFHTNLTNISQHKPGFMVKAITVYPIKSCAGFSVPKGSSWGIRPEGLAWDREWCLVHKGSGQALNQKRYTKMALLYPVLDFESGVLRVKCGKDSVTVPLSSNPALFEASERQLPSRVCGEEILPQIYKSEEINSFFSSVLGVPCVLARFPPGGRNLASRSSKASIQSYQKRQKQPRMPGTFHDMPSPPDSETENPSQQRRGRILLSNESPILMINRASVDALNQDIVTRGGSPVDETAFRANIVIQCNPGNDDGGKRNGSDRSAYLEDVWTSVHIGKHAFTMLGACRRCQMVCVNQATGEKGQEPFSTLAKTRRFDGKVYFGAHMGLDVSDEMRSQEAQYPTIQIGDSVAVHCD
jgi:molybdenum cofactor sulfurtransferase